MADLVEKTVGTNPDSADTDGDGINDYTEIKNGLDALGNRSFPTGVIATLALRGEANQVTVVGSTDSPSDLTAYVASGSHGLAIVDVSQFGQPIVLGQLDLPGDAQDVAVDSLSAVAAIASGRDGLHFVDVSDRMMPRKLRTAPVEARQVEFLDGVVYATAGSRIASYDPVSGDLITSLIVRDSAELTRLTHDDRFLYALDADLKLHVIEVSGFRIEKRGSVELPQGGGNLSVNNNVLYVGAQPSYSLGGFVTVDVSAPDNPVVISGSDLVGPFIAPGQAIVPNGSGLGLAVGRVGRRANEPVVGIVNLSDPEITYNYINAA